MSHWYFCIEPTLESWREREKEMPWGGQTELYSPPQILSSILTASMNPMDSGMLVLPHHLRTKEDTEKQLLFSSQGRDFSTSTTFLGQRALEFPQYWSRACGQKESVISGHIQPGKPRDPTESQQNFLRGCKLCDLGPILRMLS